MGKPVSDKVKNLMKKFSNATLRAAIAEYAPAAAASGYSIDSNTGQVTQDIDDPGAVQLRKDLPVIGMAGLGIIGSGLLSGVTAAQVGRALESGLSYMQPSKYVDAAVRIGKPASVLIGGMSYGNGATTFAGALADSAFDSYLAAKVPENLGNSRSAEDVVKNSMDLLPMIAPTAKMGKWFLGGVDNIKEFNRLVGNTDNLMPGLKYAQDKYKFRASKLYDNYIKSGKTPVTIWDSDPRFNSDAKSISAYDLSLITDEKLPKIKVNKSFGNWAGSFFGDEIKFNSIPHWDFAFHGGPDYALRHANSTVAHEGTHWALGALGDNISRKGDGYYVSNELHPLYDKISPFFNKQRRTWHRSPEEMAAELTAYGYLNDAPIDKDFSEWDKRVSADVLGRLIDKGWKPAQETYNTAKIMSHFGYRNGGLMNKFENGGESALWPAKITAERPRDYGDFSSAGQKKINDYALAVRQGTISLNDVPESYRGATYQRIITLGTDKAAETIGKVGLNTALALSDPVGYAAGLAAQKGLAYANDAASGRNEYAWSDALGYTPIMGTEYAAEHPVASALTDIAAGAVGGGVIRNAGNIARNAEQAAQNAAAVSGLERDVLSYPSVGRAKTFGTVYKSGTKGSGKTGTVRSAKGSYGYSPNVSAKGVFSNESSGTPSVINWYKPDAALPVSPVPFNGPGVPPILWNGPAEPQTVLVDNPEEPAVIQQPYLTIPGMSMTPEEVYKSIHGNSFETGGPVEDGDVDLVGPPVPNSVRLSNSLKQSADVQAKKYEDAYPNIAYFIRQSGNMRGETYGANERMFMEYTPDELVKIRGTKNHNVSVPRAYLDSLALNGAKSGVSPAVALGIPAQETNFGYYPTAAWSGQQMKEWAKMSPQGFAAENGGLTPVDLMNDSAYTNDPYTSTLSYVVKKAGAEIPQTDASYMLNPDATPEQLARVEQMLSEGKDYSDRRARKFVPGSVFAHAYGLYNAGGYNPGDPEYADKVEAAGADVFTSPQIQDWWNAIGRKYYEQYAQHLLEDYRKGGKIHIKPSKKGTFTAAAKKYGKSVQAFASQVLANPGRYSAAMRKKANFARNAAKWHEEGGLIDRLKSVYGDNPDDIKAAILRAKNVKK